MANEQLGAHAADRPTHNPAHDAFQRADFAQRIAETLLANRTPDSLVVGLYGQWGEGKSSVLGFIQHYLRQQRDQVAIATFNPWQFPAEEQMLVSFFQELIKALLPPDEPPATRWVKIKNSLKQTNRQKAIQTKKEFIAEAFGSYITPVISVLNSEGGSLTKRIADSQLASVETLRGRVEEVIEQSGKRLVIILDDLDRLEKQQVQAIIRLVKLTADFRHTTYLLAFDDQAVAKAIGERYESHPDKMEAAGRSYLEKIVQIPLRLPQARQDQLLEYCLKCVDEALTQTVTDFTPAEAERFRQAFRAGVLPQLKTPRMAVRYANTAQFYLPLLRGEVNVVDMLLVEAMQVFYPELYTFVGQNQELLTGADTRNIVYLGGDSDPKKDYKDRVEAGLQTYKHESHQAATILLGILFPRVRKSLGGFYFDSSRRSDETEDNLRARQAIATDEYFPRYFAYTVLSGDVSDQEFEQFLCESGEAQHNHAEQLQKKLGLSVLLQRLEYRLEKLDAAQHEALLTTLIRGEESTAVNNELYSKRIIGQLATLLLNVLGHMIPALRQERLIDLVQRSASFALVFELYNQLWDRQNPPTDANEEHINPFPVDYWLILQQTLLERALHEAAASPIYRSHSAYAGELLEVIWPIVKPDQPVVTYVLPFLEEAPSIEVPLLLEALAPSIHMTTRLAPHRTSFESRSVARLSQLFGPRLYELARLSLAEEVITEYPGPRQPDPVSATDLVRQFVYLYERAQAANRGEALDDSNP